MPMLADFVVETANNPGTGTTVNLIGAATGPFTTFATRFTTGSQVFYTINDGGALAETGIGTFTAGSPNTLSRDTVLSNTTGTVARVNFLGVVYVYCSMPAGRSVYLDNTNTVNLPGGITVSGHDSGGLDYRITQGNFGVGLRSDGSSAYLLQTATGQQTGTFNAFRPYAWNLSTGAVTIDGTGVGSTFGGTVHVGLAGVGSAVVSPGDATHPGYTAFFNAAGTRVGYAGFSDGSARLVLEAENGFTGWRVLQALQIDGGANIGPGILTVTGATSIGVTAAGALTTGGSSTNNTGTVNYSISCTASVVAAAYYAISDGRVKTNITPIKPSTGAAWILAGRPVKYTIDGSGNGAGFIAQDDMASCRSDAVVQIKDDDPRFAQSDGHALPGHRLTRNYDHDVAYLTAALQHALGQIDALVGRVTALEAS